MNDFTNGLAESSHSLFKGAFRLFLLGTLSLLGYIYLFRLSLGPLQPGDLDEIYITDFLYTFAFLFVCYWLLVMPLLKGQRMDQRHLWFAIGFSLLFRAVLLPSDLILENDIYRYMWDGYNMQRGTNPYQYAPSDPVTESYRTDYWDKINYKYVPTIYPPTLQYVFLFSNALYPGSVFGMKFVLLIFDVATIFLLLALLKKLNFPPEWCLVYAWSPLVMKEIANSGHADSVSAFLLVLFLYLLARQQALWSVAVCALLMLTKFFGILLLPLFHRMWKWKYYGLFVLLVGMLYIPFLNPEVNPFQGFLTYSKEWRFNAGVFEWVTTIIENSVGMIELENDVMIWLFQGNQLLTADIIARYSLFVFILFVTLGCAIWVERKQNLLDLSRAIFVVLGTLLICSPVIDPWYLTWIVPLLCIHPSRAWLLFTGLVSLSYIYYYDYNFPSWLQPVEFGLFFGLLIAEWIFPRWRVGQFSEIERN